MVGFLVFEKNHYRRMIEEIRSRPMWTAGGPFRGGWMRERSGVDGSACRAILLMRVIMMVPIEAVKAIQENNGMNYWMRVC